MTSCSHYSGTHSSLNTHLDHASETARTRGAQLLMRRLPRTAGEPYILCGDLNAGPDEPAVKLLTASHELVHTLALHCCDELNAGTFHGFTGRGGGGAQHMDYIFASVAGVRVSEALVDRRLVEGRWPSDHFPVFACLRWR
eukprot:gnl/Spiro4/18367_TR9827_c0_g1_i2.p2 gnl/Spiro4/18367_TR9827_c0_g1~~gnl/Spiro4/18367_TR9827_c0_g1_i2.p2  ORF type:complete len:141 (-),score=45.15 gnl/Spiro4/18367_TR9827_c0_g1_i2:73-495(-)